MVGGEATIYFPPKLAPRACRIFVRFVLSEEAPDHIDAAAPGEREGRLYQFLAKFGFPSREFNGYRASIMACLVAWPPGARWRGRGKPKLFVRPGDPLELIAVRSQSYDQPHAPSRWPADEQTRTLSEPYSDNVGGSGGFSQDRSYKTATLSFPAWDY